MSKILIDEAVVRQAMEDFVVIKYGLEKSRIWGGVDWTYNPIHPVHYLPLRDKADVQISALHQTLADAALDKMAENARELGLGYEQSAEQEPVAWLWKNIDGHQVLTDDPDYADGTWTPLYTAPPAQQEPDPDELTIAYMSGVYEGKKRKPWVGLTDEDFVELCSANLGTAALIRAVETNLKEKNTSVKATEKGI